MTVVAEAVRTRYPLPNLSSPHRTAPQTFGFIEDATGTSTVERPGFTIVSG